MTRNYKKITKAIISAAGLGTRFLPATKNQPKEMLPIIDKPIIQYLVEEAVASGITDIILVTRAGNQALEDYFDNRNDLEYSLEASGKYKQLEIIKNIVRMANFVYVRQKNHLPYGNGTPLLAAQNLIDNDEDFVYMFGDDLTISNTETPITKQLIDVFHEQDPAALLAVQEVPLAEINRYGSVEYKTEGQYKYDIAKLIEKPKPEEAPSNMAQFGRFVCSYKVIEEAANTATGKDGELWMADILNNLAQKGERIIAQPVDGEWLTTGDPLRFLKTTLKFAMKRDDLAPELIDYIKNDLGI